MYRKKCLDLDYSAIQLIKMLTKKAPSLFVRYMCKKYQTFLSFIANTYYCLFQGLMTFYRVFYELNPKPPKKYLQSSKHYTFFEETSKASSSFVNECMEMATFSKRKEVFSIEKIGSRLSSFLRS